MLDEQLSICNVFYHFKNKLSSGHHDAADLMKFKNSRISVDIKENEIIIDLLNTYYSEFRISFKKNEINLDFKTYFRSHDNDLETYGNGYINIIDGKKIKTHIDHTHIVSFPRLTTTTTRGPLDIENIQKKISLIIKALSHLVPIEELKQYRDRKIQFDAFFCLDQALEQSDSSLNKDSSRVLFNSLIAPFAGIKTLSEDDIAKHNQLAKEFKKKGRTFKVDDPKNVDRSEQKFIILDEGVSESVTAVEKYPAGVGESYCFPQKTATSPLAYQNSAESKGDHLLKSINTPSVLPASQKPVLELGRDSSVSKGSHLFKSTDTPQITPTILPAFQETALEVGQNLSESKGIDLLKNTNSSQQTSRIQTELKNNISDDQFSEMNTHKKDYRDIIIKRTSSSPNINPFKANGFKSHKKNNLGWLVLSGFIIVLGIAAIALAFAALNLLTTGGAGIGVGLLGLAITGFGLGLFAPTMKELNNMKEQPEDTHFLLPNKA